MSVLNAIQNMVKIARQAGPLGQTWLVLACWLAYGLICRIITWLGLSRTVLLSKWRPSLKTSLFRHTLDCHIRLTTAFRSVKLGVAYDWAEIWRAQRASRGWGGALEVYDVHYTATNWIKKFRNPQYNANKVLCAGLTLQVNTDMQSSNG